ncbi:MAG: hypothetical protein K5696_07580 [Lachnospiraceae bacterium]|nr:hypothetical protein [Lachnospiraceae bacterium]
MRRYTVHIIDPYLTYSTVSGADAKGTKAPKSLSVLAGESLFLRLSTDAGSEWGEEYAVSWMTSNEEVAKVDDGRVYALSSVNDPFI